MRNWPRGSLTDKEWQELVAIEYVLTWRYTDTPEKDTKRLQELRRKKDN